MTNTEFLKITSQILNENLDYVSVNLRNDMKCQSDQNTLILDDPNNPDSYEDGIAFTWEIDCSSYWTDDFFEPIVTFSELRTMINGEIVTLPESDIIITLLKYASVFHFEGYTFDGFGQSINRQ